MEKEKLQERLKELETQRTNLEMQFQQVLGAIAVTSQYIEDIEKSGKKEKDDKK